MSVVVCFRICVACGVCGGNGVYMCAVGGVDECMVCGGVCTIIHVNTEARE